MSWWPIEEIREEHKLNDYLVNIFLLLFFVVGYAFAAIKSFVYLCFFFAAIVTLILFLF